MDDQGVEYIISTCAGDYLWGCAIGRNKYASLSILSLRSIICSLFLHQIESANKKTEKVRGQTGIEPGSPYIE